MHPRHIFSLDCIGVCACVWVGVRALPFRNQTAQRDLIFKSKMSDCVAKCCDWHSLVKPSGGLRALYPSLR